MMKQIYPNIVIFFVLFAEGAFAAGIGDLSTYRQNRFLEPFVGTYIAHDGQGRERISSVSIGEGGLQMWELGGFPVFVWHNFTFKFPLNDHTERVVRRGSGVRRDSNSIRKTYSVVTEFTVVSPSELLIRTTEEDANGLHMSREERRLIASGTVLNYVLERKFYRRRFTLFGPWVEDDGEVAQKNKKNVVYSYAKQNSGTMSIKVLDAIARQRNASTSAGFGNPTEFVSDFGWADFSDVAEVKSVTETNRSILPRQPAKIIEFPSKCKKLLETYQE